MTSYRFFKMAAAAAQCYFRFRICWFHCFQKVKIYQQTKFCRHTSIHSWDIITSGLKKQTSAILEYNFWYLSRPLHHNRRVILHQAAKFCPNRTTHGGNMTSYRFCNMAAAAATQYYFRFYICWCHCFQKVKIYQQTKCRRHISIHSWYITTSGFEKQVSAILEFFFWFRSRPRRILHHAAEFRPNRTIERRNMTSYWSSKRRPLAMLDLLWDLLACRRVWEKRYKQIHKKWAESAILSFV